MFLFIPNLYPISLFITASNQPTSESGIISPTTTSTFSWFRPTRNITSPFSNEYKLAVSSEMIISLLIKLFDTFLE